MDNNSYQTFSAPQPNPISNMPPVQTPVPQPVAPQPAAPAMPTHDGRGKIIAIVVLAVVAVVLAVLLVLLYVEYSNVSTNVEEQIQIAAAEAADATATELEEEFTERLNSDVVDFTGPEDYGRLSFKYPKYWSLYIEKDAAKGGDYRAYFNPSQVDPISDTNINALRLSILDKSYEDIVAEYDKNLSKKDSNLSVTSETHNGITMNVYSGNIPGTEFQGYIAIFKIRDKTAVFRTDSVEFKSTFDAILDTVQFKP